MSFVHYISSRTFLLFDGAMGTIILQHGLKTGTAPESWNLKNTRTIKHIHESYLNAGADVLTTNTFGGNPARLSHFGLEKKTESINARGVLIARSAAKGRGFVCASVGPLGVLLKPLGEVSKKQAVKIFKRQIKALCDAEPDALLIETMSDINEALCALEAAFSVTSLPKGVTFTFDKGEKGYFTIYGLTPEAAAKKMEASGASFTGANCTLAAREMIVMTKQMRQNTGLPLLVQPNAGQPKIKQGKCVYDETPRKMAQHTSALLRAGADWIGGCCGTTPEHIREIKKAMEKQ